MPGGAIGMRAMTTPPFLDGRAVHVRSNGLAPLARAAIVCARSISSGGITDPHRNSSAGRSDHTGSHLPDAEESEIRELRDGVSSWIKMRDAIESATARREL